METPQQPARLVRSWMEGIFPFARNEIEVEVTELLLPDSGCDGTKARIIIRENGETRMEHETPFPLPPGERFLPFHVHTAAENAKGLPKRWRKAMQKFCGHFPNFWSPGKNVNEGAPA